MSFYPPESRSPEMHHWVNIAKDGVAWYRCSKCSLEGAGMTLLGSCLAPVPQPVPPPEPPDVLGVIR